LAIAYGRNTLSTMQTASTYYKARQLLRQGNGDIVSFEKLCSIVTQTQC